MRYHCAIRSHGETSAPVEHCAETLLSTAHVAMPMDPKKTLHEKRFQKKFEVSAAHLAKCFEMVSGTFADIYTGTAPSRESLDVVEKLERAARYFNAGSKNSRFYKLPGFFHFIRAKLREVKSLNMDFAVFRDACQNEWECLPEKERMAFSRENARLKRLRQKINGFELFSDPDSAEKKSLE